MRNGMIWKKILLNVLAIGAPVQYQVWENKLKSETNKDPDIIAMTLCKIRHRVHQ